MSAHHELSYMRDTKLVLFIRHLLGLTPRPLSLMPLASNEAYRF
jgi:hypothetical protein